jgi:hypothetical protein
LGVSDDGRHKGKEEPLKVEGGGGIGDFTSSFRVFVFIFFYGYFQFEFFSPKPPF